MIGRILVPVDGSKESLRGIELASQLCREHDRKVHIIHIVRQRKIPAEVLRYMQAEGVHESPESVYLQLEGKHIMRLVEDRARELDLHPQSALLMGEPEDEIIKYAKEFGIDTIIIGSNGVGRSSKEALGSVCARVCNRSDRTCIIVRRDLLQSKSILVVDDEKDILDTIEEVLPQCDVTKASSFEEGKQLLKNRSFDLAVLDIMGVKGYDLLDIANREGILSVMLTGHAVSLENTWRAYKGGAASYIPKDELANIETYLKDVFEAQLKGKHFWWRWLERFGSYYKNRFGPEWQSSVDEDRIATEE